MHEIEILYCQFLYSNLWNGVSLSSEYLCDLVIWILDAGVQLKSHSSVLSFTSMPNSLDAQPFNREYQDSGQERESIIQVLSVEGPGASLGLCVPAVTVTGALRRTRPGETGHSTHLSNIIPKNQVIEILVQTQGQPYWPEISIV